jgi:hypothetical protein
MFSDWMLRLRALFRRTAVEDDIDAELQFHLDHQVQALVGRGIDPDEARRRARLAFGGLDQIKEEYRDALGVGAIDRLRQDLRFSFRSLRATPTVTAVAVLSLALGIGANAAIFSIINSLLLRMLPVKDPARLVVLTDTPARARSWSYPIWLEISRRQQLFEDSAAWSFTRFDLSSGGQTEFVDGLWVSGSFFEALGVKAALGRTLAASDDQRNGGADGPVAVISDRFWRGHFNGAADVVGRTLRLDGATFTIVGVLPREFFGLEVGRTFDVAVPLADEPLSRGRSTYLDAVGTSFLTIIARLRADQSIDTATAALRRAQPEIRELTIGPLGNFGTAAVERYLREPFRLLPAAKGFDGSSDFHSRYERPLWTVMAVAGLVLLIACVNVANLLLARATVRRHELSLRVALGETRASLARQLLTESLLLSVTGRRHRRRRGRSGPERAVRRHASAAFAARTRGERLAWRAGCRSGHRVLLLRSELVDLAARRARRHGGSAHRIAEGGHARGARHVQQSVPRAGSASRLELRDRLWWLAAHAARRRPRIARPGSDHRAASHHHPVSRAIRRWTAPRGARGKHATVRYADDAVKTLDAPHGASRVPFLRETCSVPPRRGRTTRHRTHRPLTALSERRISRSKRRSTFQDSLLPNRPLRRARS